MANHDFESLSPDELTSASPFTSSCANTAPGCGKSLNNRLFQHIKEALVSSEVLSHFDPDWPTQQILPIQELTQCLLGSKKWRMLSDPLCIQVSTQNSETLCSHPKRSPCSHMGQWEVLRLRTWDTLDSWDRSKATYSTPELSSQRCISRSCISTRD